MVAALLAWEARRVLKRFAPRIVAVTGSVGKTSTKDAIVAVLEHSANVRGSDRSYNSEFGVPLTILGLPNAWGSAWGWTRNIVKGFLIPFTSHGYPDWLVLEVGADKPGDIDSLTRWLHPDISVVTRIGEVPVHVEHFGSPLHIVEEKAHLVKAVREGGAVVLNYDDEKVRNMKIPIGAQVRTYGFTEGANVRGVNARILYEKNEPIGITVKVETDGKSVPLRLKNVFGIHAVMPALAAIAVADLMQINLLDAIKGLEWLLPAPGRLRLIEGIKGSFILDDTYNSSPVALHAALDTVQEMQVKGKKIAVLGDMMELGVYSQEEHKKAGRHAATVCEKLYLIGKYAIFAEEGARQGGMSADRIKRFDNARSAGGALKKEIEKGDLILVKGSQVVRMERVVEEIMAEPELASELLVRQDLEWQKR